MLLACLGQNNILTTMDLEGGIRCFVYRMYTFMVACICHTLCLVVCRQPMLHRSARNYGGDRCCPQQKQDVVLKHMSWHTYTWQVSVLYIALTLSSYDFATRPLQKKRPSFDKQPITLPVPCRVSAPAPSSHHVPALPLTTLKAASTLGRHVLQSSDKENESATTTPEGVTNRISPSKVVDAERRCEGASYLSE